MKHDEVIAGHLSPCVQIFIESLLNADLTADAARDTGTTENSMGIKKRIEKAKQHPTEAYRDQRTNAEPRH
jgi:hypothetical protein